MKNLVVNAFNQHYADEYHRQTRADADRESEDASMSDFNDLVDSSFFNDIPDSFKEAGNRNSNRSLSQGSGAAAVDQTTAGISFETEFDNWMQHSGMDVRESSRSVCLWFKVNSKSFPRISMMAKEFMAATATSVPSEVAFLAAGMTLTSMPMPKPMPMPDDDDMSLIDHSRK